MYVCIFKKYYFQLDPTVLAVLVFTPYRTDIPGQPPAQVLLVERDGYPRVELTTSKSRGSTHPEEENNKEIYA